MSTPSASARPFAGRGSFDPVLLLPIAVLAGLLVSWWTLSAGVSRTQAVVDLSVTWAFAGAAVVALSRPSLRRSGWLMAAVAATWFLYDLQLSTIPVIWTLGWLFGDVYLAVVAQLVLSFPEGRIWSTPARVVVALAYVATVGMASLAALFQPDAANLLLIEANQNLADRIGELASGLGVALTCAYVILIARRLLTLQRVARRAASPLLVGALLSTPILFVGLIANARGNSVLSDRLEVVDRFATILVPLGFALGLLWSRLRHSGASSLVVELREGGPETLRDRLARALGDPTLEVAYWVAGPEPGRYVDAGGFAVDLPESGSRAVTHVVAGGAPVAALVHDPALLEEPELVESVRATAALVLENERLAAEIRAQLAEVQASRARIVAATDEERRRLERDLHDGAQQRLVGLSLKLALAQAGAEPAAADALANAQADLEGALAELREFARGVHPSILREDGLDAALQTLARRTSVPVDLSGSVGERLPDAVELATYFFVSEALTNVAKHARASRVDVTVELRADVLRVRVADDGVGGAEADIGSGLAGLSDRLAALDGTLDIESAPGLGTTLRATIPCAS
jgi:signal transduction histidine kinase